MKWRTEVTLMKMENLFINKEDESHETPPDTAAASSILFLLSCKPWNIQDMTVWSRQFNDVT